ncbi:MAG TPA: dephospho-CoA kinase [Alphaproteobacteria bacterium]
MIVVGLTGSIGMGKSVLAAQFRRLKIPVHEADRTVHEILGTSEAVKKAFPSAIANKKIDRKKLGQMVYADPKARKKLESILHPLVRADRKRWLGQMRAQGHAMAVIDVPLLFETGLDAWCDHVVCATAPAMVQKARVLKRPGMTEERLRAILQIQMPDAQKRKKSDTVINTARGYAATYRDLKKLVASLKNPPVLVDDDAE